MQEIIENTMIKWLYEGYCKFPKRVNLGYFFLLLFFWINILSSIYAKTTLKPFVG